jgi:hypothetical protein
VSGALYCNPTKELPERLFHHVRESVVHAGQDVTVGVHGNGDAVEMLACPSNSKYPRYLQNEGNSRARKTGENSPTIWSEADLARLESLVGRASIL